MKLITERDKIQDVAERWARQYSSEYWKKDSDKLQTGSQLRMLNVETATGEDVARIIGNSGWTETMCNECNRSVKEVVMLTESESEPDTFLCKECLEQAVSMFG